MYSRYLKNKSVALVGPAKSIIGTNKGKLIDQFDLTVRLNKSLPLNKRMSVDIGCRTDILYNSLNTTDFPGENNVNVSFFMANNIKFLCCSYPLIKPFDTDILNYIKKSKFKIPFRCLSQQLLYNMETKMNTRPYTGICAIVDLLQYDIKILYITGIDFYTTDYYFKKSNRYNNAIINNTRFHNTSSQVIYLRVLSLIDNRIILDKTLEKVLFIKYYKLLQKVFELNILEINNNNLNNRFENENVIIFSGNDSKEIIINEEGHLIFSLLGITQNIKNEDIVMINLNNNNFNNDNFKMGFNKKLDINIDKYSIKHINNLCHRYDIFNLPIELLIITMLLKYFKKIIVLNIDVKNKTNIDESSYLYYLFLIKCKFIIDRSDKI